MRRHPLLTLRRRRRWTSCGPDVEAVEVQEEDDERRVRQVCATARLRLVSGPPPPASHQIHSHFHALGTGHLRWYNSAVFLGDYISAHFPYASLHSERAMLSRAAPSPPSLHLLNLSASLQSPTPASGPQDHSDVARTEMCCEGSQCHTLRLMAAVKCRAAIGLASVRRVQGRGLAAQTAMARIEWNTHGALIQPVI
jgi:hypothetical protein